MGKEEVYINSRSNKFLPKWKGSDIIDLPPGDWLIFLRNGGDIPISVAL